MIFVCKSVSNPNFKYVMLKRVNTPTRYLSALTTHTKHQLVQISLKYTSTHYYPPPASHKKYPGALTHPKNTFTPPPTHLIMKNLDPPHSPRIYFHLFLSNHEKRLSISNHPKFTSINPHSTIYFEQPMKILSYLNLPKTHSYSPIKLPISPSRRNITSSTYFHPLIKIPRLCPNSIKIYHTHTYSLKHLPNNMNLNSTRTTSHFSKDYLQTFLR